MTTNEPDTIICNECGAETERGATHECPYAVGDCVRVKATGRTGRIRFFLGSDNSAAYVTLDDKDGPEGGYDIVWLSGVERS